METQPHISVIASEAFRNATTPAELMAAGERYKAGISALEKSEEFFAQGTYLWLRECFKYYMNYLTGKTPGEHPRVAHEKALATGLYEARPERNKYAQGAKKGASKRRP